MLPGAIGVAMTRSYGIRVRPPDHPFGNAQVAVLAAALIVGVWRQSLLLSLAISAGLYVAGWARLALCCAVLLVFGGLLARHSWERVNDVPLGRFDGVAVVVGDAAPFGRGLRVTFEIEDHRYDAWVYGGAKRRLADAAVGQRFQIVGTRVRLTSHPGRAQVRHVVGQFRVESVGDQFTGNSLGTANQRVRLALRSTAEATMNNDDAALFTGLVLGDDARQSSTTIHNFRRSGLSHLTAVSGQNIAFVLAAAAPLLRRCRPWWRWLATIGLVLWFMALTRFEPSVLRAGVMAMMSASAFVLGRPQAAIRILCLTVIAVVLLDPMLVWSVGFWLSLGATAGTVLCSGPIAARLPGPVWLRVPVGTSLAAQIGVALPSVLVFGRLPLVSVVANVLAVPVAGAVMLVGLPAGLVGSLWAPVGTVVMWPCAVGVRWVGTVAALGARLEPSPGWSLVGYLFVCAAVVWFWRRRQHQPDVLGDRNDVSPRRGNVRR